MTHVGAADAYAPVAGAVRQVDRGISLTGVGGPLSYRLFVVGVLLVYGNFVRNAVDMSGMVFSPYVRIAFIVGGPVVMGVAASVAFLEGQPSRLRATYRLWLPSLIIVLLFLFITGTVVFENRLRHIVLDVLLFPAVFAGILMGCKRENWAAFDKLFMAIFVVNIAVCGVGMFDVVSAAQVATRADRWDIVQTSASVIWGAPNVYLFWGGLSVWPYFVLTARDRPGAGRWVGYAGAGLFFILAAVYQKRMPFVELAIFLGLLSLKFQPGRLKVVVSLVPLALFVWFMVGVASAEESGDIWSKLGNRFDRTGAGLLATLREEDRLAYDPVIVLRQFNTAEFVVGRGLGGTVRDVDGRYPEGLTHTLHNGAALIMLKGGVILLLVWFAGWLKVITDFMATRDFRLAPYYVPLLTVVGMAWVSGFGFGDVTFVFLMMCAGRVMSAGEQAGSFRRPAAALPDGRAARQVRH